MRLIYCIECKSEKQCSMISGDVAYPHRKDLKVKNFWQCPSCLNFVGTHNKGMSTKPLGCIPNKEMKTARMHIHSILDPIWKKKYMSRSDVYKKVSEQLGYKYHTAEIKCINEARKIYSIVRELFK
jgi:hypothetical protein